jgi:hypothetical protein
VWRKLLTLVELQDGDLDVDERDAELTEHDRDVAGALGVEQRHDLGPLLLLLLLLGDGLVRRAEELLQLAEGVGVRHGPHQLLVLTDALPHRVLDQPRRQLLFGRLHSVIFMTRTRSI